MVHALAILIMTRHFGQAGLTPIGIAIKHQQEWACEVKTRTPLPADCIVQRSAPPLAHYFMRRVHLLCARAVARVTLLRARSS